MMEEVIEGAPDPRGVVDEAEVGFAALLVGTSMGFREEIDHVGIDVFAAACSLEASSCSVVSFAESRSEDEHLGHWWHRARGG
jgi:hypothetical protein